MQRKNGFPLAGRTNHHDQHFGFGWKVGRKGKKNKHWQETGRNGWKCSGLLSVH